MGTPCNPHFVVVWNNIYLLRFVTVIIINILMFSFRKEIGSFFKKPQQMEHDVKDIRTSERRFYQNITDIYATSVDYDKKIPADPNLFCHSTK